MTASSDQPSSSSAPVWSDQRHRAVRDLCENATAGPWHLVDTGWCRYGGYDQIEAPNGEPIAMPQDEQGGASWGEDHDAAFIAAARTDLPAALNEIERLKQALTVTDELISRAEQAITEKCRIGRDGTWCFMHKSARVQSGHYICRGQLAAALTAALTPPSADHSSADPVTV